MNLTVKAFYRELHTSPGKNFAIKSDSLGLGLVPHNLLAILPRSIISPSTANL